jgi:hypothetical protein
MATTTFQIKTNPSNGTLSGVNASTGAATYTPNFGFSGADSFTYDILCDGVVVDTATVSITVNPYEATAVDDVYTTTKNTAISSTVKTNDVACNAGNTYYSLVPGFVTNGIVTMNQTGAFTFTPTVDTLETGVFGYEIRCGVDFATSVVLDTATATIKIVGSNLKDDTFSTVVNSTVSGKIDVNDKISCEGGVITKTVSDVKDGHIFSFDTTTGDFTFVPHTNFSGRTDFTVKVYCNLGEGPVLIGTQKVFIDVTCPGPLPTICISTTPIIELDSCIEERDINLKVVTTKPGTLKLFDKNKKLLASIPALEGITNVPIPPAKLGDAYYLTLTEAGKAESVLSNIATVCKAPEPTCYELPKPHCCEEPEPCCKPKQPCCH